MELPPACQLADCLGQPEASLSGCQEPWQVFRREGRNYTIVLPRGGGLVTIAQGIVIRVDQVRPDPDSPASVPNTARW